MAQIIIGIVGILIFIGLLLGMICWMEDVEIKTFIILYFMIILLLISSIMMAYGVEGNNIF